MPTLPTLTINDTASWDRALAAFGSAAAYKEWLRTAIRDEVQRREMQKMQDGFATQMRARENDLATFLDNAT